MKQIRFNQRRTKLNYKTIALCICLSLVFIFSGCSGDNPGDAVKSAVEKKDAAKNEKIGEEKSGVKLPAGKGNIVSVDKFKFIIPKGWTGDNDTQVWYPKDKPSNAPLPPVSLHHGARPMMGISTLEEGIKRHTDQEPKVIGKKKVGGMKGIICQWQRMSYKSIGLFLHEESAGMDIMYFFICQAPADSFDQYLKIYQAILDSVTI